TGGLYPALQPQTAQAEAYTQHDGDDGDALDRANCATCRGPNAERLTDADGSAHRPSPIGVGPAAVGSHAGTGRMPSPPSGARAPRQSPQMTEEQTRQLAAYVASLGPGPSVPAEEWLDSSQGDATKGGEICRINCAMCHNAAGAGGALPRGKYAPPVVGVDP